jgi:hypothetical protein
MNDPTVIHYNSGIVGLARPYCVVTATKTRGSNRELSLYAIVHYRSRVQHWSGASGLKTVKNSDEWLQASDACAVI